METATQPTPTVQETESQLPLIDLTESEPVQSTSSIEKRQSVSSNVSNSIIFKTNYSLDRLDFPFHG
jgi:hypothetical protein